MGVAENHVYSVICFERKLVDIKPFAYFVQLKIDVIRINIFFTWTVFAYFVIEANR